MSLFEKQYWGNMAPLFLIAAFALACAVSFASIQSLQGYARVINYAGIVRGATQRLIKQELHQVRNDALADRLDDILAELATGRGSNGLIALPSSEFQRLIRQMREDWQAIRPEIALVRQGASNQRLYDLSENFFQLADRTVATAEAYTEARVRSTTSWLIGLNLSFILLVVLFWSYTSRQKAVRDALHRAESASQAKGEFLSKMSHEIRTPLNGIIGMTSIAKMSLDDRQKLENSLNNIELSSQFLLSLVNDILDMSRIESGKMELCEEAFDLRLLVGGIHAMFEQRALAGQIDFVVQTRDMPAQPLRGDALRVNQILVNLISNALKFTPAGGRVTLDVEQTDETERDVGVRFRVADTGIGMSEDFLQRLFEPFEQADPSISSRYGGTGLGLSIARHLLELMGGSMTVDSRPGGGSRFAVALRFRRDGTAVPATPPDGQAASDGAAPSRPSLADTHILLAEDNQLNAEIAVALLEHVGARVDHARNGQEAVDAFLASRPEHYGLILMDIQMPGLDGFQATRNIRASGRPDARTVPVLALTANAFRSDREKALQSGMDGHLAKPIDIRQLHAALSAYFSLPARP